MEFRLFVSNAVQGWNKPWLRFYTLTEVLYPDWGLIAWLRFYTLTEVFPCFLLNCKANARVKLAKTGHGPHSSTLLVICIVRLLFVFFYVLFVCTSVLPPGDNQIASNKYISYINTHYFILIVVPLQQWLHERASMLRDTYIGCLVSRLWQ
jgi:hypothetical protein